MSKVELAIENLAQDGTVYKTACAVLLASLMEEFGTDVTDIDVEKCINHLSKIKPDLKDS